MAAFTPSNFSAATVTSPANFAVAVTPSDSVNITGGFRALYCGVAGNISILLMDNATSIVFVGVNAGAILPVMGLRVNATNTTATSIVALS